MTLSYTGVNGGLVIVFADDPGMHSSQNEQDNRYYSKFSKIPMLEPSDSREAKDFVKEALNMSEKFDTPVIIRTTTRISHSRSMVRVGERCNSKGESYEKNCQKYVMIPAYGRQRHKVLLERWEKLTKFAENSELNQIYNPPNISLAGNVGIITSGVSYQYAREVFTNTPILKLSITSPIAKKTVKEFVKGKKLLIIIEELEPFLEEQIKEANPGIKIIGKEYFPQFGELNIEILEDLYDEIFGTSLFKAINPCDTGSGNIETGENVKVPDPGSIPQRPPVLCAGCPHRPVFYILKKLKAVVMGDIGCYTLSVLPPLSSLDSCLCMGAGIGQALGMEKANPGLKGRIVSVIGDSTFFHSGITPLVDSVYNKGSGLIIILDNRTTAMTGRQVHPGTGKTLMGETTFEEKPEVIARAAGIKNVKVVNPYNLMLLEKVIKEELKKQELSVIVSRQKCVLLDRTKSSKRAYIDKEECTKCGLCLKFGCPAIEYRNNEYAINELLCTNCKVCVDICKKGAIKV